MNKLTIFASACSLFAFTSCGEFSSTAIRSQSDGIHTRSFASLKPSLGGRESNGLKPTEVSLNSVKQARAQASSTDKHGMPTYSDKIRNRVVRTTAYSHQENEPGAPWRKNAIGTYLKYGQVRSAAADWSRYPVGTKFKIKGLPHTYIVDDYGSALAGTNTIDIYHPTLAGMHRWGTRKAEISVIQWGDWDRTLNILGGRTHYPHTRMMYYAAKARVASGQVARN